MGMPYDAERVGQLRNMLREARKKKLSDGLKARRTRDDHAERRPVRRGEAEKRIGGDESDP